VKNRMMLLQRAGRGQLPVSVYPISAKGTPRRWVEEGLRIEPSGKLRVLLFPLCVRMSWLPRPTYRRSP
jgi:hypothetical protein